MRRFTTAAAILAAGRLAAAALPAAGTNLPDGRHDGPGDSIRMVELQAVEVVSTRAGEKTPVAYTNVGRATLDNVNTGIDLPFLLLGTPSVVATSEAGAGIGYTGIRIRGSDATRINVTANGIPMNDAESHGVFWVNVPDLASSLEEIQVQRGVGTSTNGAGAFGGSINLKTQNLSPTPYGEVSAGYGSYNTHRETVNIGTGLLGSRWALNARLSNISSDGYRRGASTDLKSYFFQAGYYGRKTVVKFITFGGKEKTYLAWEGITKEQMKADRRENNLGEMWGFEYDSNGKLVRDSNGDPVPKFYGYYKNHTDNYTQYNYQLLFTRHIGERLTLNANLHYTDGDGYYEEYKSGRKLSEYNLTPYVPGDPSNEPYYDAGKGLVTKANLVRRKMMDNGFGGGVFSLDYTAPRLTATLGGAANKYNGHHFGNVIWVQDYANNGGFLPDHEYYRNKGEKFDANLYLKATWNAAKGLYLYADVQYRRIRYKIDGVNDKWDDSIGGLQILDIDRKYDFFNPKAGISYDLGTNWNIYASVAMTGKEPTRDNFKDAEPDALPRRERLTDYEAGTTYRSGIFSAAANFYYMKYKDQLVLTGEINHIGEALSTNVPDSYRAGIELTAGVQITDWLSWDINATFSRNKIKKYTDHLSFEDAAGVRDVETYLGTTTIAFSPSVIAGSIIAFSHRGFGASLQTNAVSKQYVTNSESARSKFTDIASGSDKLELDAYCVSNLRLDYSFRLPSLKSMTVGFTVYNILNAKYESNGYEVTYFIEENGRRARLKQMYYFPQAGTNVMANITLRF
ncbi:MAG: TonB-dependent receptor [Rikenellaceae bacterium]|nr:TonB-dependent receptor [Rikenellaceae bacterium]